MLAKVSPTASSRPATTLSRCFCVLFVARIILCAPGLRAVHVWGLAVVSLGRGGCSSPPWARQCRLRLPRVCGAAAAKQGGGAAPGDSPPGAQPPSLVARVTYTSNMIYMIYSLFYATYRYEYPCIEPRVVNRYRIISINKN